MPHIALSPQIPGIRGLFAFKPVLGDRLSAFAQELLRGNSPLTPGERETIAAYVSSLNECQFCSRSHAAAARHVLGDDLTVEAVISDPATAPVSDKMQALLAIAAKVQRSGLDVSDADIDAARAAGAGDEDIHDTVLIAAAFCMFNRYVDGLGAITPTEDAAYDEMGRRMALAGYMTVR